MFVLRLVLIFLVLCARSDLDPYSCAQVLPAGLSVVFWSLFSDWWKGLVFSFYKDRRTQE